MMTPEQPRTLNAIWGDLAAGLSWHGQRLTKDDWRQMVAGTMLLGGSSLKLPKSLACDAITVLVQIGDHPEEQRIRARSVRWSDTLLLGLGHNPRDFADAA